MRTHFWLWASLLLGLAACQPPAPTPPPQDNPYRLRPGKFTSGLHGEVRDTAGLHPHPVKSHRWLTLDMQPPAYTPVEPLKRIPAQPRRVAAAQVAPDTLALNFLRTIEDTGRVVSGQWPQWRPVEMKWPQNTRLPLAQLTSEQGLAGNEINHLLHDREGRLWIGSFGGGMSVFDGQRLKNFGYEEGLQGSFVLDLAQDQKDRIWAGTYYSGVYRWDGYEMRRFTFDSLMGYPPSDFTMSICADGNSGVWIFTYQKRLLHVTDQETQQYAAPTGFLWMRMFLDASKQVWCSTNRGLYQLKDNHLIAFSALPGNDTLEVHGVAEDPQGNFWIHSETGLWRWDGESFLHLGPEEGAPQTESNTLTADREGRIWLRGDEGLQYWDGEQWTLIRREDGLLGEVASVVQDAHGGFWISTYQGLNYLPAKFFNRISREQGLNSNQVVDLMEAEDGSIWIATNEEGDYPGGLSRWDGTGLHYYGAEQGMPHPSVNSLVQDTTGQIWALGPRQLLRYRDGRWYDSEIWRKRQWPAGTQVRLGPEGEVLMATLMGVYFGNEKQHTYWYMRAGLNFLDQASILRDRQGRTWMGSVGRGINLYDPELYGGYGGFRYIGEAEGLASNFVNHCLLEDQQGNIWIGSPSDGLTVWDGEGLTQYGQAQGLSGNNISALYEGPRGLIYVATEQGVDRLHPDEKGWWVEPFLTKRELRGNRVHTILHDSQDQLWLGGKAGLDILDLAATTTDTLRPDLLWRGLTLGGNPVDWRRPPDSLATVAYDSIYGGNNVPHEPSLPYFQDQLTFQWSAIYWAAPDRVRYRYYMEGLDRQWSAPTSESEATYSNLPPGDYTFQVRAIGQNGRWSDTLSYRFTVRPPWWQTWWAYLLYAVAALAVVWSIARYELRRRLVESEAKRLQEIDELKDKLYANITHELRTPLTVIQGAANQALKKAEKAHRNNLVTIRHNARRLEQLITQILDLASIEAGKMDLDFYQEDLCALIRIQTDAMTDLALARDLDLKLNLPAEPLWMDLDREAVVRILANLVSNAIKFTEPGGTVTVALTQKEGWASLSVQDTGIGIPRDQWPRIFDRFHQVDGSQTRRGEGTGIGLALTKELTQLMDGHVEVASEEGEGSTFTIHLPIRQEQERADEAFKAEAEAVSHPLPIVAGEADLPHLLIIEDNVDLVNYLQLLLQGHYRLSVARDGQEGIEKALDEVPDLVLTDVMMPHKDGFEVCDTLKRDPRTSHIPVVMLTAKAGQEDRLQGLRRGADVYLTKPFDEEELMLLLQNLLNTRALLRKRYQDLSQDPAGPGPLPTEEMEQEDAFIIEVRQAVLDHLTDEAFGVDQLAHETGYSRSQLHRKLKALTGKSTTALIRRIRLAEATKLLRQPDKNISEVAYAVGFNSLEHFSRSFKDEYGQTPGDYRRERV